MVRKVRRTKLRSMSEEAAASIHLAPERASEMIGGGGVELVDVRRDYEWDAGHLPGSQRIEVNELTARAEEIPQDRPVIFVCRAGNRSGMAAEAFRQAGWDAYHVEGGLQAWVAVGLPLDGEVAETQPQ
jgi:rhodanese-related sulfurtransferase